MKQLNELNVSKDRRAGVRIGPGRRTGLVFTVSGLALALAAAHPALAQTGAADQAPNNAAPKGAASKTAAQATDLSEVVVNGIPYKETVLPTRLSSSSVYGDRPATGAARTAPRKFRSARSRRRRYRP